MTTFELICALTVVGYSGFVVGQITQLMRNHEKWERECAPVIQDNNRLRTLLKLHGHEVE